jgi:PAS domain S-box-containing protein
VNELAAEEEKSQPTNLDEQYKREIKEHLTSLINRIPIGVYLFVSSPDGSMRFDFVSPKFCEIFNIAEEEFMRDPSVAFTSTHPDDYESLIAANKRAVESGEVFFWEGRFVVDGNIKWVEINSEPSQLSNGDILWSGLIKDISDRKRTEEALHLERDMSQTYLDIASVLFIALNSQGEITMINMRGCELLGYSHDDIINKNWFDLCISRDRQDEVKGVFNLLMNGEVEPVEYYENPVLNKQGEEIIISFHNTMLMGLDGEPTGVLCSGEDITERKRAEQMLEKQQYYLTKAQEIGAIGTWELDLIKNELTWTDQNYRNFGVPIGTPLTYEIFLDCVHPEDRSYVDREWTAALDGKPYGIEHRLIVNDKVRWVREKADVEFDQQGRAIKAIGFTQDITECKRLEEQLVQSQKMEAIGTLVGGIAHDFNNMLAGMTGNLYLAKECSSEMPDVVDRLDNMEDIAFHAAEMIQQLLTFARKDMVNIKQMFLNSFLKDTLKLLRTSVPENIELHQDICSDTLQINGDATQLHQVLLNLINNARDAVEGKDDPSITIRLEAWHPDEAFIGNHSYFEDQSYAHLSVEDNGYGIPEDQVEHLFEPFFTTKEVGKGTGLGLSMTFGAIKTHHGFIEVESIEGMGSTFHLYIPLLPQAEETTITPLMEKDIARGHGEVILLVDDEPEVLKVGSKVLEMLGYRVLTANNGRQAIDMFKAHADEIDLCIFDIVMPIMNGDKAAQAVRQIKPLMKIIFCTGYDKHSLTEMENEIVLRKPYRIKEISSLVRKQIDS